MPTNITHPIPLTPDPRPHADLRIQLHTHLKVSLKRRFGDLQCPADTRIPLEPARDHGIVVSLLVGLVAAAGGSIKGSRGGTVNRFMEDRVLGIMFLHRGEVVGAFKKVLPLARGVFRTDGLAVDALRRQTLVSVY